MTEQEIEILKYFQYAAHPGRQIKIISELIDRDVNVVIETLKKYSRIPQDVTDKNYRKLKRESLPGNLSLDLLRYIIGSFKTSKEVAEELRLPIEDVLEIRRNAARKPKRNGGRKQRH